MGQGQNKGNTEKQVSLADFEVLDVLGEGSFGKVWRVRETRTGRVLAMKRLLKRRVVDEDLVKHTMTERDIMAALGPHPFIVKLEYAFSTPAALYFVMEYLGGGSLFQHLRDRTEPFDNEGARFYAAEILVALQALHQQGFIYRDLKLENILLDAEGHVRLTDFGLSRRVPKGRRRVHSFSGSNVYIAPEILSDQGDGHGYSVDWWGFGVLLHLLFTQQAPFWRETNDELFALIREGPPPPLDSFSFLSDDAKDLLAMLLQRDPQERLGCKDAGPDASVSDDDVEALSAENAATLLAQQKALREHTFFEGIDWAAVEAKRLKPPFVPNAATDIADVVAAPDAPTVKGDQAADAACDEEFVGFYFEASQSEVATKAAAVTAVSKQGEDQDTIRTDLDEVAPAEAADAKPVKAEAPADEEPSEFELVNSVSLLKERGLMVVREDDPNRGKLIFTLTALEPGVAYLTDQGTKLSRSGDSVDVDGLQVDIDPAELAAEKAAQVVTHKATLPSQEDVSIPANAAAEESAVVEEEAVEESTVEESTAEEAAVEESTVEEAAVVEASQEAEAAIEESGVAPVEDPEEAAAEESEEAAAESEEVAAEEPSVVEEEAAVAAAEELIVEAEQKPDVAEQPVLEAEAGDEEDAIVEDAADEEDVSEQGAIADVEEHDEEAKLDEVALVSEEDPFAADAAAVGSEDLLSTSADVAENDSSEE
mmetsp:Transcript_1505/g.4712  ORF Transcript_1505/g.4712 Transcript_1505/m.4712 type:complete len:710 (-) Transcript_1505:31-2160(-)